MKPTAPLTTNDDDEEAIVVERNPGDIYLDNRERKKKYNQNRQNDEIRKKKSQPLFIELWPQDTVARDVYRTMCSQYGVRYQPIFAGMKPLFKTKEEQKFSFLHQDVVVPLNELQEILRGEISE